MAAANSHKLSFVNQRNEPHHEDEHVEISDSFRAVGQKHTEWQTFEKPENIRHVWQSLSHQLHDL